MRTSGSAWACVPARDLLEHFSPSTRDESRVRSRERSAAEANLIVNLVGNAEAAALRSLESNYEVQCCRVNIAASVCCRAVFLFLRPDHTTLDALRYMAAARRRETLPKFKLGDILFYTGGRG